jgi:uncharacterized protein YbjT (DUF2867 family)
VVSWLVHTQDEERQVTRLQVDPEPRTALADAARDVSGFPRLAASAPGYHPWLLMAMLGEQQISFAADCAGAFYRGLETVGRVQEQAAHQALELHERAAILSRQAADPTRLVTLPWMLLIADLDAGRRFWQTLCRESVDQLTALQQCVARYVATEQQVGAALLPQLADD